MFSSRENFRYFDIIAGASLTNEDEAGIPRYYGYTRPGGSWVIMKYDSSEGTYVFALNQGPDTDLSAYDVAWADRATIPYKRAGLLKKL